MAKVTLAPYIFFQGNAKEAMEFYKSVFGGELTLQTNSEVPEDVQKQMGMTKETKDQIMHARLVGDVEIMGSDSPKASPEAKKVDLSLMGEDEDKLKGYFDKLSEGGKVSMPLTKMFWGDTFGMLVDKYGVEWMVNIGDSMA